MNRRQTLWLLTFLVGVGVSLRLFYLTGRSLWFDEAFSWRLIQFSLPEMLARAAADVHPPLYYLLLKAWAGLFGSSLLALRLFSVTAAGFTTLALYLFTTAATASRRTGLVATLLFTLSGFQIQYAWEARMYTLGTALALLSSYLLLKAIRDKNNLFWLGYAVAALAFAYTHYFAFFTIASQALFALFYTRGRQLVKAALSASLILVGYLPWLPTFFRQNSQVQEAYWIPPIGGWSIPDTFYRLLAPTTQIPRHAGLGWIFLAALPLAATIALWLYLTISRRLTAPRDARILVVLAGLVPFIITIAVSFLGQSLYQDRFFVFTHIFIIIALAILLSSLRPRPLSQLVTGVAALFFIFTFVSFWRELDIKHRPGAQAAAAYLAIHNSGQEPIIVSSPFVFFAIAHYAQEQYPQLPTPQLYSTSGQLAHFAGGPILKTEDIVGPALLDNPPPQSLWVVDTTGFGAAPLQLDNTWAADRSQTQPEVFPYQGDVTATRYIKQ